MKHKIKTVLTFIKKHLKIIIPIVLVIVIVVVVVNRANESSISYIEENAQVRNVATYLTFTGNVEAVNDASLIPKIAQTVTAVNVSIGDEVKKGDVIATLDDTTLQASIAKQEATLSNSELSNYYTIRDSQKTYSDYRTNFENGQNSQLL